MLFVIYITLIILYYIKDLESEAAKVFLEVGNAVDHYTFGISNADEVLKEYEAEDGTIILFKKVIYHVCVYVCVYEYFKYSLYNLMSF